MKILLCIISALFLFSCASTSAIVPAGEDNFIITSTSATMSTGKMKIELIKKATDFCTSKNQTMSIINSSSSPIWPGHPAEAELMFRCN